MKQDPIRSCSEGRSNCAPWHSCFLPSTLFPRPHFLGFLSISRAHIEITHGGSTCAFRALDCLHICCGRLGCGTVFANYAASPVLPWPQIDPKSALLHLLWTFLLYPHRIRLKNAHRSSQRSTGQRPPFRDALNWGHVCLSGHRRGTSPGIPLSCIFGLVGNHVDVPGNKVRDANRIKGRRGVNQGAATLSQIWQTDEIGAVHTSDLE